MRFVSRLSVMALSLAALGACSDDDGGTAPPTQTISVATSTSTVSAARGASATVPITVTRGGGYTGTVALSATGLPSGVTASFSPASLAGSATTSTLTLNVDNTAAGGTSTITINASGTGVTSQTTSVTLTIPSPAITLATGSSTGTIVQGATTSIPVTITRTNGFTGPITLTVDSLPTGVTAAPLTIAAGATTGTLVLTATAGATPTTAPRSIIVRASGTGVTSQTATIGLTVNSSVAPGYTLTPSRASITSAAGSSDTTRIALARAGGFTGSIALAVDSLPTGITATFAPTSLADTATSSKLTIAATSAVAPGTYSLRLRGTATGQTDRTQTIMYTVTAAPGINFTFSPDSVTLARGGVITDTLRLTRAGGFTGAVALTATGLPAGLTATFAPTSLTDTTSRTIVTLRADSTVAAGRYNIMLTGTGTGGITRSITLPVTVSAPAGITLTASNVTLQQGATGTSTVRITRTGGFAGATTFSVNGLPAGVTASFSAASATDSTSTLTLMVPLTVAAGTYTGMITGMGPGVPNSTATFTLTVNNVVGGDVAYRFCANGSIPTFFAYRNGTTGNFTAVTASANSTFSFTLSGSVGQIAYAVPNSSGGANVTVVSGTAAELAVAATRQCVLNPATRTVTGTVAGLGAGQSATIQLGGVSTTVNVNGSFTLAGAPDQATDLVAARTTVNQTTLARSIDRVVIRRNVNVGAGGTITPTIDFGSAEATAPSSAATTITNAGSSSLSASGFFQSANGGVGTFASNSGTVTSPVNLLGLPSSLTQAGDFQGSRITATDTVNGVISTRTVSGFNREVGARSLALGAAATAPTFTTVATSPYARIRAQGTFQSDYPDAVSINYTQGFARNWTIAASRGAYGLSSTGYDLEIPDLSGLAGFNNAWGLVAGVPTQYTLMLSAGVPGFTSINENTTFRSASRSGTLVP